MKENKVLIYLRCPICKKQKRIIILKDIINNKKSGILPIFVSGINICEHSFYAYINKHFKISDYFIVDTPITNQNNSFELIKRNILKEIRSKDLTGQNLFKFISERDLQALLYACFLNIEIIFIEDYSIIDEGGSDQFKFVFAFLMQLFPENFNLIKVISTIKFKDYLKLNARELDRNVYVLYGKVFSNDVIYDKIFEKVTEFLKQGNSKMQQIKAIVTIEKLKEYSEYFKQKINILFENRALKVLKRKFKKEEITPGIIKLIKRKYDFLKNYKCLSEIEPNSIVYVQKVFNKKLLAIGFTRGVKIEVKTNIRGSVVVSILNTKIALGLTATNQIFVKDYDEV